MGLDPGKVPVDGPRRGRGPVRRVFVTAAIAALCAGAIAASAIAGGGLRPNPANDSRLVNKPIDDEHYDGADGCRDRVPPGMKALERWLGDNIHGETWGIIRCERLKDGNFSLHSEGRAIDWHLDAGVAKERRAAIHLIDTLLAADRAGNVRALARRMGIQGLIFDCRAWWAGMEKLGDYSYCYRRNGELRNGLDRTQAHRDHIHIELNWDGARKQTSFWRSPVAR